MADKARQSNIELLRILSICGVVVLHYNGNVAFNYLIPGTLNFYILYGLEVLFACAVNLFVLLSGYFLSKSGQRRVVRALELIIQVIMIGAVKYVALNLFSGQPMSLRSLVGAMLPNNYFVTLYIVVYLLSPYINVLLDKLSAKRFGILLGLCLCLFAVWPTILDMAAELTGIHLSGMYTTNMGGSQAGYSGINFILMYLIGAYLRRYGFGGNARRVQLLLALVICVGILYVWQRFLAQSARAYCNPFVIFIGIILFLLFERIEIRSRVVNTLAKGAFTCFLFHDLFLPFIGIEKVVNGNTVVLLCHLAISVVGIFLVSWIVWRIYSWITEPVFRWIGGKLTPLNSLISINGENE